MSRPRRIVVRTVLVLLAAAVVLALLGAVRPWHVVTVTRGTSACQEQLWQLWADVENRPDWDRGLDYIEVDGAFAAGTTGTVKVEGQDPIRYTIVSVEPEVAYTDRFESLPATHTDWHHTLEPRPRGGFDVTWRLEAQGPFALLSLPVLKAIFGDEIPTAVDEYVALAERRC